MFINDFVVNGHGVGSVGEQLEQCRYEPGLLRPYLNRHGVPCVTINTGRTKYSVEDKCEVPVYKSMAIRLLQNRGINNPVWNATTLRKEQWIELDRKILLAARFRLKLWNKLEGKVPYGGFNGMGKLILEHENMNDPGEAMVDMDGLTEGRTDSPKFGGQGLPLPITHSDFWFSERRLAASRSSGTPLNTVMAEAGARRIAETLEKTTIGNQTGMKYGGLSTALTYGNTSQVYGLTNFPNRLTKTNLTTPTSSNQATVLANILTMMDQMRANKFFGPFSLYHSNDWDQYLDNDYILSGGNVATMTLRERVLKIDGIQSFERLDFLFGTAPASTTGPGGENLVSGGAGTSGGNPFTLLLVQETSEVIQAVNGMDITTVQWPSVGGLRSNFKIMCIKVPWLRADQYGNCGILHATTA